MPSDHRSQTLKRYQGEVTKVSGEAQQAFLTAEDALAALEDREARRSARTSRGQQNLDRLRNR